MSKQGFLKGLIFKDVTGGQAPVEKSKSSGKGSKNPVQPVSTTTVQGVADNKFIDLLEGIIEQSNQPGQDYFEFKQALENMNSLPMDERTKFQTVYSVLSLQGCTKDVLIASLDKYVQIIQSEKTNFDAEMQSAYDAQVKSKLLKAEESKKELESLTKRLAELNGLILALSQEAQAEEMKIRATEANFKASADIIISEMIGDKDKINNYLS